MRRLILLIAATLILATSIPPAGAVSPADTSTIAQVASPDGNVEVRVALDARGQPIYSVQLGGGTLVEPSPLGLATTVGRWTRNLEVQSTGTAERVTDRYRLLHGKSSQNR